MQVLLSIVLWCYIILALTAGPLSPTAPGSPLAPLAPSSPSLPLGPAGPLSPCWIKETCLLANEYSLYHYIWVI